MVHTNTCTRHSTAHMQTRESVRFNWTLSAGGIIGLLQDEGLVHLPSVFYSGCQNGEEETEQDTWFTAVICGKECGTDGFNAPTLKSLKWTNMKLNLFPLVRVQLTDTSGVKYFYVLLIRMNDLTFCHWSLSHLSTWRSLDILEWRCMKGSPANLVFTAIYEWDDRLANGHSSSVYSIITCELTWESAFPPLLFPPLSTQTRER